jgi:hypothetical protein
MDHQSVFRIQLTSSCGEWSKVTSKVVLVYNMKEYGGIRVYYCLSIPGITWRCVFKHKFKSLYSQVMYAQYALNMRLGEP